MNNQDTYCCAFDSENSCRSGNFEFRFSGPESIPNAVKRYNALRGAELAQIRRQRDSGKQGVATMPRFCKVRHPGQDITSMVTSRDLDVVTQLSLDSEPISNESGESNDEDTNSVDDRKRHDEVQSQETYSVNDPQSMRLCGGADADEFSKAKSKGKKKNPQSLAKPKKRRIQNTKDKCHTFERLEELHREVCAELQSMEEPVPQSPVPNRTTAKKAMKTRRSKVKKPKVEQYDFRPGDEGDGDSSMVDPNLVSFEDYHHPEAKWVDIMPSAMMSQAIKVNVCKAQNATPLTAYQFMEQHGSLEPEPLGPFFLEDSDLEYEYADRQGYFRYREPRPRYPSSEDATDTDVDHIEKINAPCFVELEKRPYRLSLLRSLSPMRYTSQRSEETLRTQSPEDESRGGQTPKAQRIDMSLLELQSSPKTGTNNKSKGTATQRATKGRTCKGVGNKTLVAKGNPTAKANTKSQTSRNRRPVKSGIFGLAAVSAVGGGSAEIAPSSFQVRQPGGSNMNASVTALLTQTPLATSPERQGKRRRPRTVVYSKSLEDLKFEKLGIYNKITMTQERIINSLDKLQNSLLHLQVPHCNAQERQKRQRNAFEFCVRFSRNFLYPLKGMIDDVRITSVASFNSATSNEACQRVVCVYGLMQQSIQTYQRQLRYFLLDKVPQKLSALIEMIYTMTNCCLEKGMLDRHDPVVECLLERCTRFMSFIEDMQEERFKLARETLRRLQRHGHVRGHAHALGHPRHHSHSRSHVKKKPKTKAVPPKRVPTQPRQEKLRSHERYDLKMCLNDLKLYEPRLVPKEHQTGKKHQNRTQSRVRRIIRSTTNANSNPVGLGPTIVELPSDLELQSNREEVQTQMQMGMAGDRAAVSSSISNIALTAQGDAVANNSLAWPEPRVKEFREDQLHQALLDAFRLVSRSQVQQVLDPLMRSLGVVLSENFGGGLSSGT
ncbi:hypothetical protein KR074_000228, partial [Drosophila pseudoananassae]